MMALFLGDPCGITCILITYACFLYGDFVVVFVLLRATVAASLWGVINSVLFNICVLMAGLAHLRAVTSDPGRVPLTNKHDQDSLRGYRVQPDGFNPCYKCEIIRPRRAHHCRVCRRCILKMDHHCPWINNCVGELNQKYFIQFLVWTFILCIYSLVLVAVTWFANPLKWTPQEQNTTSSPPLDSQMSRIVHSCALSVEAVLFALFVVAIFCDQCQAIASNRTAVEVVKNSAPTEQQSTMNNFRGVFGNTHWCYWILPCSSPVDLETHVFVPETPHPLESIRVDGAPRTNVSPTSSSSALI